MSIHQLPPPKRQLDIAIISDIHLGTFGCHAEELLEYLDKIQPRTLILNGDIVDMWQFTKHYWPKSHMKVLQVLLKMASQGVQVHYLTGNHDDILRRFSPFSMGFLTVKDKLVLNIDGKRAWIFHGDVLDSVVLKAKWLARLGGIGYDLLILFNRFINHLLSKIGKPRMSLSKKIKNGVKRAVKHITEFENVIAELAIKNHFDYVICGHIHKPEIKSIGSDGKSVTYMNSGDWVENLSALEYCNGEWSIHYHYSSINESVAAESIKQIQIREAYS